MAEPHELVVAMTELKGMLLVLTERVDGYHTDLTNRIESGDRQNAQVAEFLKSQHLDLERRVVSLEVTAGAYAPGAARIQELGSAIAEIGRRVEKVDLVDSRLSNIEASRTFTFRTVLTSIVLPLIVVVLGVVVSLLLGATR